MKILTPKRKTELRRRLAGKAPLFTLRKMGEVLDSHDDLEQQLEVMQTTIKRLYITLQGHHKHLSCWPRASGYLRNVEACNCGVDAALDEAAIILEGGKK